MDKRIKDLLDKDLKFEDAPDYISENGILPEVLRIKLMEEMLPYYNRKRIWVLSKEETDKYILFQL